MKERRKNAIVIDCEDEKLVIYPVHKAKHREMMELIGDPEWRRLSFILPAHPVKRRIFTILRMLNIRRIDEYTRKWKGPWIVVMIQGNETYGSFNTRDEALEFENNYLINKKQGNEK